MDPGWFIAGCAPLAVGNGLPGVVGFALLAIAAGSEPVPILGNMPVRESRPVDWVGALAAGIVPVCHWESKSPRGVNNPEAVRPPVLDANAST